MQLTFNLAFTLLGTKNVFFNTKFYLKTKILYFRKRREIVHTLFYRGEGIDNTVRITKDTSILINVKVTH
jgi:hypothetical protein